MQKLTVCSSINYKLLFLRSTSKLTSSYARAYCGINFLSASKNLIYRLTLGILLFFLWDANDKKLSNLKTALSKLLLDKSILNCCYLLVMFKLKHFKGQAKIKYYSLTVE